MDPKNQNIQKNISKVRQFFINDMIERIESDVDHEIKDYQEKIEYKYKIERAEKLIEGDDLQEAGKLMEEISATKTDSEEYLFLKGFLLYMTGTLKQAIPLLKEVTTLNPNHEKAKKILSNAEKLDELIDASAEKMTKKEHTESIKLLTKVLEIDGNNSRINQSAYFQRALANFSLGKSGDAFLDFKKFESLQIENQVIEE